ncbi:hypothetical protein H4I96_00595 [Botrytis cinerea]
MSSYKILLIGATGYVGGSILTQTLLSIPNVLAKHSISVLIRGEEKVPVFEKMGVKPILFNSLEETEFLRKIASGHDIIIYSASGYDTAAAKALVAGLGDRKKQSGKEVHYIHTTGASSLSDQPTSGKYLEDRIFSDKEDIFAYEKFRQTKQVYPARTTDIGVIETGLKLGKFNTLSIQFPMLIRASLKAGQALVIGDGKGVWSYVHIDDLAKLYIILLQKILDGEKVPMGEQILFAETGTFSWIDASQAIADALYTLGAIKTVDVKQVPLEDAASQLFEGDLLLTELAFSSNSRTKADLARELGWKPMKTEQDFKNHFLQEAKLIFEVKN